MALDFPSSPAVNDKFTSGGRVWLWDGTKWTPASTSGSGFLPLSGGTMQGGLVLADDPVNPLDAATKQYVDVGHLGGFVNRLRNGTMDIWQRGQTVNITGGGGYTADGWIVSANVNIPVTIQPKIGRSIGSLQIAGAAGLTAAYLNQRIESAVASPIAGQVCTVQLMVQNNTGAAITPQLSTSFPTATDNYASQTTDLASVNLQTIAAGATAKVAYTFPVSANAVLGYNIVFYFGAVTSGNIRVSDADLRATPGLPVGLCANPPPPELRPIAIELAFCQRYYRTGNVRLDGYAALAALPIGSNIPFGAPMRATPTMTPTWTLATNVQLNALSATTGQYYYYSITSAAVGAYTGAGNFTASAEL